MRDKRIELSVQVASLLDSARSLSESIESTAILILAEVEYDFRDIQNGMNGIKLIVASDKPTVREAAREDDIDVIELLNEPGTRQNQLGQALLEGIADELISSGETVVTVYAGYDREDLDTISIIPLGEQLSRLTSRDLQRLETQVPLETLRIVVDLACEIGREGREGKSVGALFVVGNDRKVMQMSHEGVHDPFRGYSRKECKLRNPRVRESVKELAQIDGAFVIASDGTVVAAGRILDAPAEGLTLSKGLGSRHWAAAAISKATKSIAIAISESTGTVRLFQDGVVVLRIEPMDRAMKWREDMLEPPPSSGD
ncbi:MAG: DNA integrity scanning protein DisA nucleotide-binding domain protein [Planctomycetaceae bacterium]|nr:DNA integrity scanning protein DisA nucleotide-binding domain protein [Planctomycetaceae bacterium]